MWLNITTEVYKKNFIEWHVKKNFIAYSQIWVNCSRFPSRNNEIFEFVQIIVGETQQKLPYFFVNKKLTLLISKNDNIGI